MKIINVSDRPFEFTFDSGIYPADGSQIMPGQIVDYPDEIAQHAIKRSIVTKPDPLDDTQEIVTYRMQAVGSVDKAKLQKIVTYECPFAITGQCKESRLPSMDALRAHMETHWSVPEPVVAGQGAGKVTPAPASRR